jgi:hypothetical protein
MRYLIDILSRDQVSPPLAAGEIVATRTLTRALPISAGETWTTELTGIAVTAKVQLRLSPLIFIARPICNSGCLGRIALGHGASHQHFCYQCRPLEIQVPNCEQLGGEGSSRRFVILGACLPEKSSWIPTAVQ